MVGAFSKKVSALFPNKSITVTLFLVVVAACSVVGGITLIAGVGALKLFNEKSSSEGLHQIKQSVLSQLVFDSELLSETLAGNLRDPLYKYDLSRIRSILREVSRSENVTYVYLSNSSGEVVHDGTRNISNFGQQVSNLIPSHVANLAEPKTNLLNNVVHVQSGVYAGDEEIGRLFIGMKDDDARSKIEFYGEILKKEQSNRVSELIVLLLLIFLVLMILFFPLVYLVSRKFLNPISELVDRSNRYEQGDLNVSFELKRQDEFGALGHALGSLVKTLEKTHQQVWNLAYLDNLTELPNRRRFYERLDEIIIDSTSRSEKFAMFFIDLDFFKQVNDSYGHDTGDLLLKAISARLLAIVDRHLKFHAEIRRQNVLVSRISGDEFVLILPIIKVPDAKEFAESMYERFDTPLELAGREYMQTVSTGITYFPYHAVSAKQLMKNADIAMYQAKRMGRSTFCEFNEVLKSDFNRQAMIKQTSAEAFNENQFFIEYQPIVTLSDSSVIGAEALVRWAHPKLGRLWPSSFISVFDESRLTTSLSIWMLEKIVEDYQGGSFSKDSFRVTMNITSKVFLDPKFTERMIELVQQNNLPRGFLCVELTETDLRQNIERCRYYTKLWLESGISLWVDDFGGASSSLTFLNELPVDTLKVNGPLVRDVEHETVKPIIQAIKSLATAFDVSVIATGLESEEQIRAMRKLGCEFGQGFCFGAPVSVSQFPVILETKVINER